MSDINNDPILRFREFFDLAVSSGIPEPNAMSLATVGPNGHPSLRMVLLKEYDERGFVFYTNLESRKGGEIAGNPNVALCLFWQQLGRSVRIEGACVPVSDEEADTYFRSRARGSRIGAWASKQSRPLSSRQELLETVHELEMRYPDEIPRPPFWSGFRVIPKRIEFWVAGEFRLHDRTVFERATEPSGWDVSVLYP